LPALQRAQRWNSISNAPSDRAVRGVPLPVVSAAYSRGMFPGGQPDMAQLLKQAQEMQQQLVAAQEQLAETEVTGTAGGGLVSVTMTGSGDVTAVTIAPAAVDPDDLETLQDLVVAALHDAKRAADELAASTMGPLAGGLGGGPGGGLGLPGL
jgi:DNA-binding YbaB/EbfC family protein